MREFKNKTKQMGWKKRRKKAVPGKRMFRPLISDMQEVKTGGARVQDLPGLQSEC